MANNENLDKKVEDAIMGILGKDYTALESLKKTLKEESDATAKQEKELAPGPSVVYEHGHMVEVDGKKLAKGCSPKKGKTVGGKRIDATRDAIKVLYAKAIKESPLGIKAFQHSTEGLIVRLEEADYAIKITRSKEFKIDVTDPDFLVEKDYTVRGKTKNSTAAIARLLEKTFAESGYRAVDVRATAITLHVHNTEEGQTVEYVVKISKKRERVGFEAESCEAYI